MVKEVLTTHYPRSIPPIKPYLQSICPNPSNYINHHQPHNPNETSFSSILNLSNLQIFPFSHSDPSLTWPCHRWLHGPPPCCTAVGPKLHPSAAWHETNFHPSRCCRSPRRPSPGFTVSQVMATGRGKTTGAVFFLQEWELWKHFLF